MIRTGLLRRSAQMKEKVIKRLAILTDVGFPTAFAEDGVELRGHRGWPARAMTLSYTCQAVMTVMADNKLDAILYPH